VKFHTKKEDSHEETRQTAPVKIGMPMKGRCQIEDGKSTKGKLITPGHDAHKGREVGDLVRFLYTMTKPRRGLFRFRRRDLAGGLQCVRLGQLDTTRSLLWREGRERSGCVDIKSPISSFSAIVVD
jgi:hypothetical protein